MSSSVRLNKLLSTYGVASRRAADVLITQGRVEINGKTVRELGTKADPERDEIKVDGRRLKVAPVKRYLLMYKPVGVMSTRSDPQRRTTVCDLVDKAGVRGYFFPVGRLDYDSEGLIILTNDGAFAERVSHPRYELERTYEALVEGVPDERDLERLRRGVPVEGQRTQPAAVTLTRVMPGKKGEQSMLQIVIHEGRNRQIRRMADAIAHPVARLKRVRIGHVTDASLRPGDFRDMTPNEIRSLLNPTPARAAAKSSSTGDHHAPSARIRRPPAPPASPRPPAAPRSSPPRRPQSDARSAFAPRPPRDDRPASGRRPSPAGRPTPRSDWRKGPGRRPSARPRRG